MTPAACEERSFAPPDAAEITAWIAIKNPSERYCLRTYAGTQTAVHATFFSNAREIPKRLSQDTPRVLVMDTLLREADSVLESVGLLAARAPAVLLITPLPSRHNRNRALRNLETAHLLPRPFRVTDLFETVYLLGADDASARLYRVRRCCAGALRAMRADPTLNGSGYLERMVQYALLAERELPLAELYELAADEQGIDTRAVTAAVDRLSRAMQAQGTPAYRALCERCGLPPEAKLSNGRLVRALIEWLRDLYGF